MTKAALKELQSKLIGSVTDNADARAYFSTDGSIFTLEPTAIVYPENTADVRKTVKFAYDQTSAGRPMSVTPRGLGTDQGGGALGEGLHIVFPARMNRLLSLERDHVTVQPGINYRTLQQTLQTHGHFLPPYPSSIDYSTLGGAVGNNAAGEKTIKYGSTSKYTTGLKVILDDGTLITTQRISARELKKKLGLSDREGEIYRGVDQLVEANSQLIATHQPMTTKNTAGYALRDVKRPDGSFDLTPLIVGSQGTLGVVTEITLQLAPWNPRTSLVVGYVAELASLATLIPKLLALNPSALEIVDYHLLKFIERHRPQELEGLVPEKLPAVVLLIEFDDFSQLSQTMKVRRAHRILGKVGAGIRVATDPVEQTALWKLRHSAAAVIWMDGGPKKALPFIEDGIVPVAKLPELLSRTYELFARYNLEIAVWGHAGDGNLHLQPFLDLSKRADVDTLFELAHAYFNLVIELGGSTCAEHNDGLMRGPYLEALYGPELCDVFRQVKALFDPSGILNPGKKLDATEAFQRAHLRKEYSMKHLYDHLPKT